MGVVGLGLIAQTAHLPALRALNDRAVVTHLCDLAPGRAEAVRRTGFPTAAGLTDWRALEDAEVDAVVVCTPGSHGRIAERLLSAGKHVLAEKPLALSRAECRRLAAAARSTGVALQVGYMKMHEPMVRRAAEELSSIGELRHVRITVMHPADEPQTAHVRLVEGSRSPMTSAAEREITESREHETHETQIALGNAPASLQSLYVDVLNGSVVHQLSLLRALVGSVPDTWDAVSATPLDATHATGEPPCLEASARLGERTTVALSWNWVPEQPAYAEWAELIGSRGSMRLTLSPPYHHEPPSLTVRTPGCSAQGLGSIDQRTLRSGPVSAFQHQMTSFLDAVGTGEASIATVDDASSDVESMQALTRAVACRLGESLHGEAGR